MKRVWRRLGPVLLAGALIASLAGATDAAPRHAAKAAVTRSVAEKVRIKNFSFKPKRIEISKGEKVKWTNRDGVTHTVTANNGTWDSGNLSPDEKFIRKFKKVGTFKYHCSIHPDMHGTVIVG